MDVPLSAIIVLVVLIIIKAFFSASQTAVSSLSEARLKKQAEGGDKRAAKLLKLTRNPNRVLSALQIVIALADLLSAALAAVSFSGPLMRRLTQYPWAAAIPAHILNLLTVILITVVLACFSLVLGELAPEQLAMKKTETVARLTVGPVSIVAALCRPLAWLLSKATNAVLRLLRIDPAATGEDVSEDEIRMMVDLGEEQGAIQSEEKELIENIFEFNNTTAEDVMVHRTDMVLLWADDTSEDVIRTIRESGLSRFPVYEEDADDIIGILNTRDYLLNTQLSRPKTLRALLRPAYFVPESVRTDVLFRDMQSKKVHLAIVVDEYGGTSGLVTMEDLLEEIVGNIYDEFDPQEEKDIEQLEDNLWRVSGACVLERLAEVLEMDFPGDEESDTLGGLVFAQLSVIPEDGSQIEMDIWGLHIRVTNFTDRRVEWAQVSKLPADVEPPETA